MGPEPKRYVIRFCGVCQLPLNDGCACIPTPLGDHVDRIERHEMVHASAYDRLAVLNQERT